MFYAILYGLPNKIRCTFTVFIYSKVLPNLWQKCLEKPLLFILTMVHADVKFMTS